MINTFVNLDFIEK